MEILEKIKVISKNPYQYATDLKQAADKPVVGNFCSYTPEELIYAAGGVPFRLFGTQEDIVLADAHLQSYCCSLVRGGLEDALRGRLKFLAGAVFPHTCDSIQRLSDIWRLNAGLDFHLDVVLPVKLDTESARTYMIDVLRDFKTDLETVLGVFVSDDRLWQAIRFYNRLRRVLADIYDLRAKDPDVLSAQDLFHVVRASMIMDRDAFLPMAMELKDALAEKVKPVTENTGKRILLSGGICNHPDIYGILEASGGEVVWDDLCTGTRYFEGFIDENNENDETADPVAAIARRYMSRVVCPAKHLGTTARGENLLQLVKAHDVAGVVFLFLKFCDPHGFDYPYLKKYLDDAGVPSLLMEVEAQLPSEGQLKTRFETFMDMI